PIQLPMWRALWGIIGGVLGLGRFLRLGLVAERGQNVGDDLDVVVWEFRQVLRSNVVERELRTPDVCLARVGMDCARRDVLPTIAQALDRRSTAIYLEVVRGDWLAGSVKGGEAILALFGHRGRKPRITHRRDGRVFMIPIQGDDVLSHPHANA